MFEASIKLEQIDIIFEETFWSLVIKLGTPGSLKPVSVIYR